MLLQTNSYIVPKEKRAEHARLMRRFRQVLNRIGCDDFEIYEQVGANWSKDQTSGRFVQIMRFRDKRHQLAVQNAERTDPSAQALIAEFCNLIDYPLQQQQQQFAVGFYHSVLPAAPTRIAPGAEEQGAQIAADEPVVGEIASESLNPPQVESLVGGSSEDAGTIAEDVATADATLASESQGDDLAFDEPPESAVEGQVASGESETEVAAEQAEPAVEAEVADTATGDDFSFDDVFHPSDENASKNSDAETVGPHQPHTSAEDPLGTNDFFAEHRAPADEEDDHISRLAEELSAGEPNPHAPRRPANKTWENGSH